MWQHHHHRFGLAGEGQADLMESYLERRRGRVLNVGCGPWPEKIKNLACHCDLLIVADKSTECARMVKGAAANVIAIAADARDLPLPGEAVDHVVALGLFAYISDTRDVLSEFKRVCRPGSYIMITNAVSREPERFRLAGRQLGLEMLEDHQGYCPAASGTIKRRQLVVYGTKQDALA